MTIPKKEPTPTICLICGTEFTSKPSRKYCGYECKHKAHLIKQQEWAKNHKDEMREYRREYNATRKKPKEVCGEITSGLESKLKYAAQHNTNYAEIQKAETLRMYGRVEV